MQSFRTVRDTMFNRLSERFWNNLPEPVFYALINLERHITFADFRGHRRWKRDILDKFGYIPIVGDKVEDCRGEVHTITSMDDEDTVLFEDGFRCSLHACCDVIPRPEKPADEDRNGSN
jgi:hypothetical protein